MHRKDLIPGICIYVCSLLTICTLAGCYTPFSTIQEADTLEPGTVEVGGNVSLFNEGVGVRIGILEDLEAGVYYNFFGYSADLKYQILNAQQAPGLDLSIGAGIGNQVTSNNVLHTKDNVVTEIPLYITYNLTPQFALIANPYGVIPLGNDSIVDTRFIFGTTAALEFKTKSRESSLFLFGDYQSNYINDISSSYFINVGIGFRIILDLQAENE